MVCSHQILRGLATSPLDSSFCVKDRDNRCGLRVIQEVRCRRDFLLGNWNCFKDSLHWGIYSLNEAPGHKPLGSLFNYPQFVPYRRVCFLHFGCWFGLVESKGRVL